MSPKPKMSDVLKMLTIDDVAKKLNVPVTAIKILIDTNRLPHYRLGQHGENIRIIQRDLSDIEDKQQSIPVPGIETEIH